ncbi:hypothetical protein [Pedobacter alpinus]|uniref:DUF4345 domain-containing protein n=1 Tax=Pedobacter alpinus TaxID=1590643 RepID=A0ABW5TQM7_9SPHI
MKWTLRFFAFLDLLSFYLMAPEGSLQLFSFFQEESFTINEIFSRFLYVLLWFSLLASAFLLAIPKKAGIIIYYCQLLPRFIFLAFSIGFVSSISYYVSWVGLENLLFSLFIFAEMLRIYWSYKFQKDV